MSLPLFLLLNIKDSLIIEPNVDDDDVNEDDNVPRQEIKKAKQNAAEYFSHTAIKHLAHNAPLAFRKPVLKTSKQWEFNS